MREVKITVTLQQKSFVGAVAVSQFDTLAYNPPQENFSLPVCVCCRKNKSPFASITFKMGDVEVVLFLL